MATVTGSQSDDWMIQESNWNVKNLIKEIFGINKKKNWIEKESEEKIDNGSDGDG